ncbi:thermonuclease family protein [Luminiphilus sp.]|nr:thermonuclease family protein [Luminiphilus sp.]
MLRSVIAVAVLVAFIGYGFVTDYLGDLAPKATAQGEVPASAVEHRVKRIVDGDTVYMRDGTKVRLHGIDTPEDDQPYGKQATRNLDKLIGGKVLVVEKDTDRYGRLVGTLYTPEGVNVNLEMVCNGSAWWYSRYAKNNRAMSDCQAKAKEAGLGLWESDDPMPPWEWRRR